MHFPCLVTQGAVRCSDLCIFFWRLRFILIKVSKILCFQPNLTFCTFFWVLLSTFKVLSKVVAGAGAMLFGFLIVYDTQQIFGSASASFGGGKRDLEYTLDMQLDVLCLWWEFLKRGHCSRKLLKCLADTNRYCRDLDEIFT